MATTWRSVYTDVCNVLLELPTGLTLGLFTEQQFLDLASEILLDFTSKTGIVRKIFNIPFNFGISTYDLPDQLGELESATGAGQHLFETSDFLMSNADAYWATQLGAPQEFKQDEIAPRSVLVSPSPNVEGNQVTTVAGAGGYGQISATGDFYTFVGSGFGVLAVISPEGEPLDYDIGFGTIEGGIGDLLTSNAGFGIAAGISAEMGSAVDFDVTTHFSTPVGFGVINGSGGNPYLEVVNPAYGLVAVMVPSTQNLSMYGSALPYAIAFGLEDAIELVPDSLTSYLRWGILSRVFGADTELKDSQKQNYSDARYREGINLCAAVMDSGYSES